MARGQRVLCVTVPENLLAMEPENRLGIWQRGVTSPIYFYQMEDHHL